METISKFETLFALRTGLTVLLPRHAVFDGEASAPPTFTRSAGSTKDIVITSSAGKQAKLTGLAPAQLEDSIKRGFIMFYEMEDEDMVRCTPCHYAP